MALYKQGGRKKKEKEKRKKNTHPKLVLETKIWIALDRNVDSKWRKDLDFVGVVRSKHLDST